MIGAFCYCSGLTSITIPDSVISIDNYTFQGCDSLDSIISNATIAPYNTFQNVKINGTLTVSKDSTGYDE